MRRLLVVTTLTLAVACDGKKAATNDSAQGRNPSSRCNTRCARGTGCAGDRCANHVARKE